MNRTCDMCDRLFNEDFINWIDLMDDYGEMKRYTLCPGCIEKIRNSGKDFFNLLEILENKNRYKNLDEPVKDIGYYIFVILLWALGLWFVMEFCFQGGN